MANQIKSLTSRRMQRSSWVVLFIGIGAILFSLLSYQAALADAGGNPTKTPTPSLTPTITQTPPEYIYPTQIVITGLPPESLEGTPPPVAHQLPVTTTPLSEDEILAALTATAQAAQAPPARSAGFWFYMLLLLGISAAVVGIIFFAMWSRNRNQMPPLE